MTLFRLGYNLWATAFLLLVLSATSRLIFGRQEKKLTTFLNDILFAIVWPIMIFSKDGFAKLIQQIKKYI